MRHPVAPIRQQKSARRRRDSQNGAAIVPPCVFIALKHLWTAQSASLPITSQATDCDVLVLTKCDLLRSVKQFSRLPWSKPTGCDQQPYSGRDWTELCETLRSILASERTAQHGQAVAATAEPLPCEYPAWQRTPSIGQLNLRRTAMGNELIAVELRTALHELGKVVGAVYTDDLLDRIFSTFCIGK